MRYSVMNKKGFFLVEKTTSKENRKKLQSENDFDDVLFLPFSIEGKVTLEDLTNIFLKMQLGAIQKFEKFSDANLYPYLVDVWLNPPKKKKKSDLKYIEVYGTFEIDNFDGCDDTYDVQMHWSAHGIGKTYDKKNSNSNMWAIEFTPWQDMLHLPLTIRKNLFYTEHTWKKLKKPREMKVDVLGQKKKHSFGLIDRQLTNPLFKSERTFTKQITFVEFFNGLFNELCFFGSPTSRDGEKKTLMDRSAEVDEFLKKKKK